MHVKMDHGILTVILTAICTFGRAASSMSGTALHSRRYERLFAGGTKIIGSYASYFNISRIRCGAICNNSVDCWVYTYNSDTNHCDILGELTAVIRTEDAPSNLHTYYVRQIDGKRTVTTPRAGTWQDMRDTCQTMGGDLFVPETTSHAIVLHYAFAKDNLWIGIYRPSTGGNVYDSWLDVNTGTTPTSKLNWQRLQPNGITGSQFKIEIAKGYKNDLSNYYERHGLCSI